MPTAHPDPHVRALLVRPDLPDVARSVLDESLLGWVGDRPLAHVLATLRAPLVRAAIVEVLAHWRATGTGPRG